MIRKGLLSLLFSTFCLTAMLAQGVTLTGKVIDEKGEPVPFATIAVFKNGIPKTGGQTDFDGAFRINNIDPGSYDVECSQVGKTTQKQTGVKLTSGIIDMKFKLVDNGKILDAVQIVAYKVPLVKIDQTSQGGTLTSEQIRALPTRDVNALAAITAGVSSNAKGDELNFRGSRKEGTNYYIDGIRVRGNSIPANEIEQLQVITGGIDAKYGDVTGGIISISTKGPARKFTGGFEVESSQYLDAFGSNFFAGNLSGPIITRTYTDKTNTKVKETVLGFRMSGQVRRNLDKDPSAVPVYKVKDDVLKKLEERPFTRIDGGAPVASAEFLTAKDFDKLKINPGNTFAQYDFTGKLDARINKAMDVTLSGAVFRSEDQITPSSGNPSTSWRTFNSDYNPTETRDRYRANFRFRHKLGGGSPRTEGATRSSSTTIENAQYQLQVGYEQLAFKVGDIRHKDNFFNYGYIGKFTTDNIPFILPPDTAGIRQHVSFTRVNRSFELSDVNRVLANYNRDENGKNLEGTLNIFNSQYNLGNLRNVYSFHQNVGQVYDLFRKTEELLATATASLNFDILPKGSKEKAHNIEMGFLYEQRTDREYQLRPFELWRVAGSLQNGNINGTAVDTSIKLRDSLINGVRVPIYKPLENKDIKTQTDLRFYKNIRDKFGIDNLDFADVDRLDPSRMSLDLFTARELNDAQNSGNNPLLSYRGFDYLGNRIAAGKYSFNDFFKATDGQGTRIFPVAPLQPLYVGGYIQDKFRYKDVIFSLGLRVDRFDANTKVMKDQYSLYDVMTAKDFYANVLKKEKPSSVGDDYKVYINSNTFGKTAATYSESSIKGFRQGDQWFNAKGQPLDPVALFGESGQAFVKYVADTFNTITQRGYDPNLSFTDYKPQTTLMPRLAFSFPIGEKANFFAHYDILAQRPAENEVTALNYFYFDERAGNNIQRNANLRPERTIDYEVGFQQELSPVSALKLSAYYKEMRDMVQLRIIKYLPSPLKTTEYQTYDNVDFGTVKGFSIAYDLRRTNHFSANMSYLLQFANGTGSDAASSNGLNRRGIIRTLSPLNYDERHSIKLNCDYRYDEGAYDGPKLFGVELFKNAGANIQVNAISGRPYTKRRQPTPFGASQIDGLINSSALPWQFVVDARIDKTITFAKNLRMNVFLRVQNLLDRQNVADVYKASGEAGNDGYLQSEIGKQTTQTFGVARPNDFEAYNQSYLMRLINPDFYFFPRRIFLGAVFDF